MKLLIDIDKELKSAVNSFGLFLTPIDKLDLIDAINNGTPIPEDATNGDVIKAMFGKEFADKCIDYCNAHMVGGDWWNAPYKTESEE